MLIKQFYNLINSEINALVTKFSDDENIKRHKENRIEQRKSYAFLIWFLEFYGQKPLYKNYITDGNNDYSCDIIFSNTDSQNQTVFYVVQSKWVRLTENRELDSIDSEEFGKSLTDFSTILSGNKKNTENEKFNKKYIELIEHLEKNGKVKFIFFTLAKFNNSIEDAVNSFCKNYAPNVSLDVIDINRIRRDYIEFKFKQIQTNNPLEYNYNPEESIINLPIERFDNSNENLDQADKKSYLNKRDFIEFEGREKAYIFLLRPKTIYDLFEKYKFNLFFKNVRNPIHESNYNKRIVETLTIKPRSFWYFNNGLTAITEVIPEVGIHAKEVTLNGLQIINGAQTVYSVYQAYKNASERDRTIMDTDARVTLRLIRSSDEDFNLEITKFTNSQNPLYDRDFVANHEVQQRLQDESFNTNIWYEKRRDEFRMKESKPKEFNVKIVPNYIMTPTYVAFHLQNPINAITKPDYFFISRKEDSEGLYEDIFNEHTKYDDMLASFYMWNLFTRILEKGEDESFILTFDIMFGFAISNIILTKYLKLKYPSTNRVFNLNLYIKRAFEEKDIDKQKLFLRIFKYSNERIFLKLNFDNKGEYKNNSQKLTSLAFYQLIKDEVEEPGFTIDDIENQNLKDIAKTLKSIENIDKEIDKNALQTIDRLIEENYFHIRM